MIHENNFSLKHDINSNCLGIIGCCRQNFIDNKYNYINNNIGNFHSTKEIITLLEYMISNNIINDDTKYVFQKPMFSKKNLEYSNEFKSYINNTKIFLIEISSMKTYKYKNLYVHHVLYDTPDILGFSKDIKEKIIKKEQEFDEIEKDIIKIKNILKDKKIIIVTHIKPPKDILFKNNRYNCDSINKRFKLIEYLKNICSKLNISCIDPVDEISKKGYNICELVKKNDNYLHYNFLGEKIMREIYKEYIFLKDDIKSNIKIYCIFHNKLSNELVKYNKNIVNFFGVNEDIKKIIPESLSNFDIIYEYKLTKYDKFFQECGYNESSAIIHIGINNLHTNSEFIGFCQYDNVINYNIDYKKNSCYYIRCGFNHITDNSLPLNLFFNKYNSFFKTNHNLESLINLCKIKIGDNYGIPLLSTFIIHTSIYNELYKFWTIFMYDIFYICKIENNSIPKHHRHIGGIMERIFGITLILNEKLNDFIKIDSININTKKFNYQHSNGDDGDGYKTSKHIIQKYTNHEKILLC